MNEEKEKQVESKTEECFNFSGKVICNVCKCEDVKCDCNLEEKRD